MALTETTKFGLTFGQILAVMGIAGALITVWVSLNVRIAQAEIRIEQLEKARQENIKSIERLHQESRDDYKALNDKLDKILYEIRNHK
jgi:hypothetical protein